MVFSGAGFVALYVSSVAVFVFVLFCIISFPMAYILTCSDLYFFVGISFLDLPSLKLISRFGRLRDQVFTVLSYSLKLITCHAICRGIRFHTFFGHFSRVEFSGFSYNILLEV